MRLRLLALGRSTLMLALFARFVVLAAGWVGDDLTTRFLAADLNRSLGTVYASGGRLDRITAQVAPPQPPAAAPADPAPPQTMLERFRRDVARTMQSAGSETAAVVNAARSWVPDRASIDAILVGLPDQIVRAIEIFLVQTVLAPLCVAGAFYGVLRGAMRPIR